MHGHPPRRPVQGLNALADDFDPSYSPHANSLSSRFGGHKAHFTTNQRSGLVGHPRADFANYESTSQTSLQTNGSPGIASTAAFDPFVAVSSPLSAAAGIGPIPANPYSHDAAAVLGGAPFFPGQTSFQQPVRRLFPRVPATRFNMGHQRMLTFCRFNTTYMPQLVHIIKTP